MSTVFLPLTAGRNARLINRMDLRDILPRIERRLQDMGLSAQAASERAGSKDLIRNWRRSVKAGKPAGMTTGSLLSLADVLKTTEAWLLTGEGDPEVAPPSVPMVSAPLISWVSASGLVAPDVPVESTENFETVYGPGLDATGNWIALSVVGSSMDRISPPESIIFVNRKDRRLVANACYVIRDVETGEATYKRFRPAPDRWEPVTFSDEHDTIYPETGSPIEVIGRVRLSMIRM